MIQTDERLSIGEIVSYSLPIISLMSILWSVMIFLPNYYTDELGVTAGMLSWIFLIRNIWDAVTDPIMGHISDRTRTRWGRRRPYMLASALPLWALVYLIWSPPIMSLSLTGIFIYFTICYVLFFTFYTVFYIPYYSLGMELTPDYHERNRLFGGRQVFGVVGTFLGTISPPLFTKFAGSKVAGYSLMGNVLGGISVVLIILTVLLLKERKGAIVLPKFPFIKGLYVTFRNQAFIILFMVYIINTIGHALLAPLAMYIAKYVIKAEWIIQPLILTYYACSLLSVPLWVSISKRIGKKNTYSASILIATVGFFFMFFLAEGRWWLWMLCAIPTGAASGCSMMIGSSIKADVIDSDELETGTRREGAFVGVWSLIEKAAYGISVFIGLQSLSLMGYEPNVEQTGTVLIGMRLLVSWLPAALGIVAVLIFQRFPITPEVHDDIRAQLDARNTAAVSVG